MLQKQRSGSRCSCRGPIVGGLRRPERCEVPLKKRHIDGVLGKGRLGRCGWWDGRILQALASPQKQVEDSLFGHSVETGHAVEM